ncbi:hypothetical protein ACER0C_007570 [Sarotherodon galilaeus]
MSAASCLLSEDQFLCSICLDVFTDPVSTPCGHNFCKNCISQHWDISERCQCPVCKKVFQTRPELHTNTFISDMVSQFRRKVSSSGSEQQAAKTGEVPCDICTGTKLKALKSCLVCLASYCQTHLEPHLTASRLKRHQLIDPEENLEGRMCVKHDQPLELFCKTDQTCVCMLCSVIDHKTHAFVPLREEYEGKKFVPLREEYEGPKSELVKTEAEIQQMIQKTRLKIQEIKEEKAEGVQVFTALKESVDRCLNELIKEIEDKQETTEKQAEGFIKDLEQEISELMKRSSEVEQLSHSKDHLHLLQSFSSLKAAPTTKDWTETLRRRMNELIKEMEDKQETTEKQDEERQLIHSTILLGVHARHKVLSMLSKVDVTLDPDTAHPELIVSDDGKQVQRSDNRKECPHNPKRFSKFVCVLGKQSFSSGRFYFEVQVKDKTKWILGVVRESVNRKEAITPSPEKGYWTVAEHKNICVALDKPQVHLSLQSVPEKVGVFVDYEEGLVSFHDVDHATLVYSFTGCSFMEKLCPLFYPGVNDDGKNSSPLTICPVMMGDCISDDDEDDDN